MIKRTKELSLLVLSFWLITSCGGEQPQQNENENASDTTAVVDENVEEAESNFIMTLPSPLQIASIFRRSGMEYIPGITNKSENISNYNTKSSQKLNFGVYSADLAYSALNDQNQDCINYVKSISELSEKLWLTNVFSSISVLERFENNLGNTDSLGYVIADFQMDLDNYLEENGLSQNSILIFTGAWIESMFIGLKSLELSPNPKLTGRLIEQRKIIANLVKIIETDGSAYMNDILDQLKIVNGHFKNFKSVENIESEEELAKITINDDDRRSLLNDVTALRTKIVNG